MRVASQMLAVVLMVLTGVATPMEGAAVDENLLTSIEIEDALHRAAEEEAAARENVRTFLNREDVRRIASEAGLGALLDDAVAAVDTLGPEELGQVTDRVTELNDELAGGLTITISLVALLLIVIIVILLVD